MNSVNKKDMWSALTKKSISTYQRIGKMMTKNYLEIYFTFLLYTLTLIFLLKIGQIVLF